MLRKEYYAPADARSTARRAYSKAVITEGGKTIWLAGQTAQEPGDFEAQVREIFEKLGETIRATGGTGLHDMVTMTVFIKDVRLGDRFVELRREIFNGEKFPASALITVSAFARPETLVEVQGVAVVAAQ
jgi:enamine deaminase RidA (YjgF/YER057c/UK114 family)